jgi:hypothetical protein
LSPLLFTQPDEFITDSLYGRLVFNILRERLNGRTTRTAAMTQIEHLPSGTLRPWPKNSRTHSRKQVRQIADSIRRFGFTNPVLIDSDNMILAGHARVAAAQQLGWECVPCVRIDRMTPEEKRAYVIADNKLALNAGWDEEILAEELKALQGLDLGFDIGLTGFSIPEIDSLIEGLAPEEPGNPEDDRLPKDGPPLCRPGDIWALGPHRLICASALEPTTVTALMNGEQAQMVFTDPPYNVPIQGHVGGSGAIKHREFAMASGEMTQAQFTSFLRGASRTWRPTARMGRSTSSAWTGAMWPRCLKRPMGSILNSRT